MLDGAKLMNECVMASLWPAKREQCFFPAMKNCFFNAPYLPGRFSFIFGELISFQKQRNEVFMLIAPET